MRAHGVFVHPTRRNELAMAMVSLLRHRGRLSPDDVLHTVSSGDLPLV